MPVLKLPSDFLSGRKRLLFLLLAVLLTACDAEQSIKPAADHEVVVPAAINFNSLLEEMIDRDHLTHYPERPYRLLQASSYDRRALSASEPGWFANEDWIAPDRRNFIREETRDGRIEWVIMEAWGPGAITRFWVGGFPQNGYLRFYIDGNSSPVLEGPATDLLGRDSYGFGSALASVTTVFPSDHSEYNRVGFNLYAPIPYAQHIKVSYQLNPDIKEGDDPRFWYNINYRQYPKQTEVISFSDKTLSEHAAQLAAVNRQLLNPGADHGTGDKTIHSEARLQSGESLMTLSGDPGAIEGLQLHLQANDMDSAMRDLQLRISFDGWERVSMPVGHFFGSGLDQLNRVQDWYRSIDPQNNTLTSYWLMPYAAKAKISLINSGEQALEAKLELSISERPWSADSLYFNAAYRKQDAVQVGPDEQARDWTYIDLQGKGLYVGDTFSIFNYADNWWGEGDEKIYIDGEASPSHFGTGTEDYYGYAWGRSFLFNQPFIGQPQADASPHPPTQRSLQGPTVNSRVRALDAIPFRQSIKVDMELWHWEQTKIDVAVSSFWYGR